LADFTARLHLGGDLGDAVPASKEITESHTKDAVAGSGVGVLFAQHAAKVERLVARHASGDVEDACQVAWERLIVHEEVDLDGRGVVKWLVITAARVGL